MLMTNQAQGEYPLADGTDRIIATLSYITVLGWVAAFMLHQRQKTQLGAFHLRQTFLLYLLSLSLLAVEVWLFYQPSSGWMLYPVVVLLSSVLFLLWLFGLIGAIGATQRPMPLIGRKAQEWFSGIKGLTIFQRI